MTTMYSMRTIVNHDVSIDRPICMYEMKNINGNGDSSQKCRNVSEVTGHVITILETPLAEVAALEARQEKVLGQLAELKQQVLNLCDVLKGNNQSKPTIANSSLASQVPVFENLVVNVNPSRPCYSILALKKLWKNVDFRVSPFTHSSVKLKNVEGFAKTQPTGETNVINLSLIWKDVMDLELIVSGIHGYAITSESNFLRYLVRLLGNECYEKSLPMSKTIQIDRILDWSHQMIYQETVKDKQKILALLNKELENNEWFCGNCAPGIADVAVWSAIKQSSIPQLPSSLKIFYERCENIFLN